MSDTSELAQIPAVVARFGLSRSRLYKLAAEGRVRFVKLGCRTLVDVASVRALLSELPPAYGNAPAAAPPSEEVLLARIALALERIAAALEHGRDLAERSDEP